METSTMTTNEMTTKEHTMTNETKKTTSIIITDEYDDTKRLDIEPLTQIERVISTLLWHEKIAGQKLAKHAVVIWSTLREHGGKDSVHRGMKMSEILEAAGEAAEPLRDHRDGATSKLNLTARLAAKTLIDLGLIKRSGHYYYDVKTDKFF